MNDDLKIFAGEASSELAWGKCRHIGCDLGKCCFTHFSDGEFCVSYEESIRGKSVFLAQVKSSVASRG